MLNSYIFFFTKVVTVPLMMDQEDSRCEKGEDGGMCRTDEEGGIPGRCLTNENKTSESDLVSPDFSLSPQTTLKCSDEEQDLKAEDKSHESSSDSIETLEDLPNEDSHVDISNAYLQKLSLINNSDLDRPYSVERMTTEEKISDSSCDSHEVISRPESLSITSPKRSRSYSDKSNSSKNSEGTDNSVQMPGASSDDPAVDNIQTEAATAAGLPQGTITRRGDMIQFVADDLTQKIKLSSPMQSHAG